MSSEAYIFVGVVALVWALAFLIRTDTQQSDVLDLAPRKRWPIGKLAVGLVAIVVVGTTGYFGNHYLTCQRLEEDLLNSFGMIKSTSATIPLVANGDAKNALNAILDQHKAKSTDTLIAIGSECGQRAADTAHRKATELIFQ